jgi:2-polyprenyl-3-methyl-5-hydroxy-6-metoxy-1,4-benzoquinol methylase
MRHLIRSAAGMAARTFVPEKYKEWHELSYWRKKYQQEAKHLSNDHYEQYYTTFFGLDRGFYAGKRLIDIGCGPRGSLEWADMAAERVGLDTLANEYRRFGSHRHKMTYVDSASEAIPFDSAHFDAAFSFNSLDHVRDLDRTISEIKRIVRPGGMFLLIVELNHEPTPTEPQHVTWEVVDKLAPEFKLAWSTAFEIEASLVYQSIDAGRVYDRADPTPRPALLCARFERQAVSSQGSSLQ